MHLDPLRIFLKQGIALLTASRGDKFVVSIFLHELLTQIIDSKLSSACCVHFSWRMQKWVRFWGRFLCERNGKVQRDHFHTKCELDARNQTDHFHQFFWSIFWNNYGQYSCVISWRNKCEIMWGKKTPLRNSGGPITTTIFMRRYHQS